MPFEREEREGEEGEGSGEIMSPLEPAAALTFWGFHHHLSQFFRFEEYPYSRM